MAADSLEALLQSAGSIVELLRNQQTGPNVYPGVPAEYTNWRDEQWAWQHSACSSTSPTTWSISRSKGPTPSRCSNHLGINSFKGFVPDKAKQFVPVTPEGYVIGDVHPLLSRREQLQPGRPRAGDRMGRISRRDRRLERHVWSATSAAPCAATGGASTTASRSRARTR